MRRWGRAVRCASMVVGMLVPAGHGAGQPADLPDSRTFLREAREVLARSQQEWHRFAYKERRTEIHMNPFGRMGMGDTLVLEVRPSADPQLTYRRVIERNGAPVSNVELDRQDAEYRARAARVAREAGDDGDADRRERDDALARRRARMMIDDVVRTLRFELVRRELRGGRPSVVVSFAGRPDARPVTRQGRIARVFKGLVWIDEASREVTHLTSTATDDVSFAGFIAKIYEGTEATVERQEIEPGIWMPMRVTLRGEVRALFRRARIDYRIEWFDYRRIH